MTCAAELTLRTVAFGDLGRGAWGALVCGAPSFWVLGAGGGHVAGIDGLTLDHSDPAGDWGLVADGLELTVAAAGDAVLLRDSEGGEDLGFDQLCHVRGRTRLGREERTIEALGVRGGRAGVELARCDSVRAAWAWFEPADGLALVAVRPRKHRGHGRDALTASVLQPSASVAVADPRLSTTYGADGSPLRAGVELWLEQEGEQYPRRAAGETIAAGEPVADRNLDVRTALMRWHMRGSEGTGVYMLARSR